MLSLTTAAQAAGTAGAAAARQKVTLTKFTKTQL